MKRTKNKWLYVLCGALCGIANGFFGGGGGMIIVPFLIYVLCFKTKVAHATALLIILPVTVFSAAVYISTGNLSLNETVYTGVGVAIGGFLGAKLLPKLPQKAVTLIFAGVMLAAGVKMAVL